MRSRLGWCGLALVCAAKAHAEDFYIDPDHGAMSGDGSEAAPWQTLEAVVKAGHFGKKIMAGDSVWLRAGYHGALAIKAGSFSPPITLAAVTGQVAKLQSASFAQTHGWVLQGVSISPSHASSVKVSTIVQVDKASSEVVIRDCEVFSVADASAWGSSEWMNASSGLQLSGDHVTASGNRVKNVRFGISVDATNALIEHNQVVNFSADGMRGLGDHEIFQYNLVKNVYLSEADGDDNHDDGFQSWSTGPDGPGSGVVHDIVLRGNYFLNREDPSQKYPNDMQGIGCFDGFFEDWLVENNVVATNHWHGISFYGMRNSRVLNNTVIDIDNAQPGPPWIMVTAHKNGSASENVLVRNNLATDYDVSGTNVTQDHNTELKSLSGYFVDSAKFDLHLSPTAPARDQGSPEQAPALDADGIARPQGSAVDLGAYEWHEANVQPSAGAPAADGGKGGRGGSAGTSGSAAQGGEAEHGAGDVSKPAPASGCSCQIAAHHSFEPVLLPASAVFCWVARYTGRRRRRTNQTP